MGLCPPPRRAAQAGSRFTKSASHRGPARWVRLLSVLESRATAVTNATRRSLSVSVGWGANRHLAAPRRTLANEA
jgi:hypothetical protein